jgi:hypothetical protein
MSWEPEPLRLPPEALSHPELLRVFQSSVFQSSLLVLELFQFVDVPLLRVDQSSLVPLVLSFQPREPLLSRPEWEVSLSQPREVP